MVKQMERQNTKLRTITLARFIVCLPYPDFARTINRSVQQDGRYFILLEISIQAFLLVLTRSTHRGAYTYFRARSHQFARLSLSANSIASFKPSSPRRSAIRVA